jgi:chemotaxis protein methyltransferase CheR
MSRALSPVPWSAEDFRPIAAVLRGRPGGPLPPQRLDLIRARLQARLRSRGLPSFTWFHENVLRPRPGGSGMQMLIDLSTVNHTTFFREAAPLWFLAERLAERLRGSATATATVRVWSAGCSAGQEPYSLAMTLAELLPSLAPGRFVGWASDMSLEMIRTAARAIYPGRDLADVSPERLRRFFLRGRGPRQGAYRIVPEVRRLWTFLHFDLHEADWPVPDDLDAILCRNVAIYFAEADRRPLLDRLAGRLRDGGWLAVGNCEILPDCPPVLRKVGPSMFRKESGR